MLQAAGLVAVVGDEPCPLCRKQHGDVGKLEESPDTKSAMDELKTSIDRAIEKARAANAPRLAEVQAELAAAKAAKAALPKKQRGPYTEQIAALEKEERGLAVHLTGMMGVVKCKDDGLIFAGTSLFQYSDVQAEMPGAWHSPKPSGTLANKPAREDFETDVLNYARHGQGSLGSWPVEWEKLQQLARDSYREATDEVYYPPGAAPRSRWWCWPWTTATARWGSPSGIIPRTPTHRR
ncbi:hypothetical protein [Nannocystis pusilla]|uniref:hypothetical protein n=1 Tax=Nannocystis pusilla TaxID=889268 RepID=UPI003B798619